MRFGLGQGSGSRWLLSVLFGMATMSSTVGGRQSCQLRYLLPASREAMAGFRVVEGNGWCVYDADKAVIASWSRDEWA